MMSILKKLKGLSPGRKVGRFAAVDFDRRRLRVVLAESGASGTRILKLVTADMPEGFDLTDAGAVGELLGRTLREMRLRNPSVLMSVPRGQAVLKPLVLPPVKDFAELADMVLFQAQKELTFRPDEAVIDFTIESHYRAEAPPEDEPQGEHVLVAAVQRPVLAYYQQVAEAAGARLLRLGLRPYADMRCVEAYGGPEVQGRLALVHVTAHEAEIDVMDAGGLTFSRSAVIDLSEGEGETAAEDHAVRTVVQEAARSLQSYLGVERDQRIDAILVAGGTGIEPAVADQLAQRLRARCQTLDVSRALDLRDPGPDSSAFISALGLAAAQGDADAPPFDFLNPKRAPVRRDLTKMITVGAVAAVVLVVVGAFAGAAVHLYIAGSHVGELTQQLNTLNKENKKVDALKKRVDTIERWVNGGRDWLLHWAAMSCVFPSCTDTYVTNFSTNPDGSMSLGVKATGNEAIDALGDRLASAGYGFKPGQVTTGSDPYGYGHSTSLKVIVKPDMALSLADLKPVPRPGDDVSVQRMRAGRTPAPAEPPPAAPPHTAASETPAPTPPAATEPSPPQTAATSTPETPEAAEAAYKAWREKADALQRERPDKDAPEEVRNQWSERMRALMRERPRTSRRDRTDRGNGETRYPNGRFQGRPPGR